MNRAFQFVVTLVLLLAAYAGFVGFAPQPKVRAYQSLAERNTGEAQHVLFGQPAFQAVLVGSSLGARLQYRTFDRCFQNLSLAGQSALTGLELLSRSGMRPAVVMVEINILHRDVDQSFIDDVERPLAREVGIFRAENRPVNLATSYLLSLRYSSEVAFVGATETETDPRVVDLGLSLQLKGYALPIDAPTLAARIQAFRAAVETQRANGARVVLVEMPVHAALRDAPRALQIRSAMRQAFPELDYWDVAAWDGIDPVRTRDGVHLALADAVRVGAALARRLQCPSAAADAAK